MKKTLWINMMGEHFSRSKIDFLDSKEAKIITIFAKIKVMKIIKVNEKIIFSRD